jgi:FAD/FMN-containing dehydrogenase
MKKMETALKNITEAAILSACFFDSSCAAFAEEADKTLEELKRYPSFPPNTAVALWLELAGEEAPLNMALEAALIALEETGAMADTALAATEERDFERLERLRHLLTEAANLTDRCRPHLLADITVPHSEWSKVIQYIVSSLKQTGLSYILMGHFLWDTISLRFPGIQPSAATVLNSLLKELRQCRCEGDHGIGRIKKSQFRLLNPLEEAEILKIKKKLDPAGTINSGVLVDA